MPNETQLDTRQIQPSKSGFTNLYEQLEFGRFNSVKSGAAPTMYQEVIATKDQMTFTIPNGHYTLGDHSLQVYINGQLMRVGEDNDYIEVDSQTIMFLYPLEEQDIVVFRVNGGTSGPSLHENHKAIEGQTVFSLNGSYATGNDSLIVYVNGAYQTIVDDYVETDAKTVTFTEPLESNDLVTFRVEGLPTIVGKYQDGEVYRTYDTSKRLVREEFMGDDHIIKEYFYAADGKPEKMIIRDSGYTITRTYTWDGLLCTHIDESVKEGT